MNEFVDKHHQLVDRYHEQREGMLDVELVELIPWLEKQTPMEWHAIAESWNYDCGPEPLQWILSQPCCDKGTAACVFGVEALNWIDKPVSELRIEEYIIHWNLCKLITDNWRIGFYKNGVLRPRRSMTDHERVMEMIKETIDKMIVQNRNPSWDVPVGIFEYRGSIDSNSIYCMQDHELMYTWEYWCENLA
ncbi:MAG: DUF4274 domain-containing protein [Hyphomicrobiales bacterium]|nr:DUF4274 domain-containing protein [Hyphomicrobiales bacterium]